MEIDNSSNSLIKPIEFAAFRRSRPDNNSLNSLVKHSEFATLDSDAGGREPFKFAYKNYRISSQNSYTNFVYLGDEFRIRIGTRNSLGKHSEFELLRNLLCGRSCARFAYRTYRICSFPAITARQQFVGFACKT